MRLLTRHSIALAAVVALPLQAAQAQPATDAQREQVRTNFREADADRDGALTPAEFNRLIDLNAQHNIGRAKRIAKRNRYDLAFAQADANADGSVTPGELSAFSAQ